MFLVALLALPLIAAPASDSSAIVEEFVAAQTSLANQAFDDLYGDGLGIDGETPVSRAAFVESFLVEALNREARRVLLEKGYVGEAEGLAEPAHDPSRNVRKKGSPETLEGEIAYLAVQKRQAAAIRDRARDGKGHEPLDVEAESVARSRLWRVPCAEPLAGSHVYSPVPGCSPGGDGGPHCARLVVDGFTTNGETSDMVAMMERSFEGLFHQGEETLLVPEADSRERMGNASFQLTGELLERVRRTVASALNISGELWYSGSLLKRLDHPPLDDGMQVAPDHVSSNPHVDKANIGSYDWSALLYFSTADEDFGGGELVFHDVDADRIVRPVAGRLLAFSSGFENLHRVLPMRWGRRYVLSMWFTCSARHAHRTLAASVVAPAEGPRRVASDGDGGARRAPGAEL